MLREQCLDAMRLGRRSSGRPAPLAALASCVAVLALAAPAHAGMGFTTRESLTATGGQADDASYGPSLSADGSLLAFQSDATNLVPGDNNGHSDIFVRDRTKGTVTRVSVASDGTEANNNVEEPAISGDGRYVAFTSTATNLDFPTTSGFTNVYVHDRLSGTTRRVSKTPTGGEPNSSSFAPSISRDGRYVAFESYASNLVSVLSLSSGNENRAYVYDTQTDKTVLVSVTSAGDPASGSAPSISADGRYVAFSSNNALVPGDTNGVNDVYIRDRDADGNGIFDEAGAGKTATTLVSVASDGTSAGNASSAGDFGVPLALSADGRQVAFTSKASNLVAGDTNSKADVFARDLRAGKTTRVSVASDGSQANDASAGFGFSLAISADGRRVAFASNASNLVAGDTNSKTDVFVRDRDADANGTFDEAGAGKTTTTRESVSTDGGQGNANSGSFIQQPRRGQLPGGVSLTEDGTGLAFGSMATNLVADDTNSQSDVFGRFAVAQTGAGSNPPPGGGSSPPPGGGSSPPPGGGSNPPPGGGSNPTPGGGGNPPPGGGSSPPPGGGGSPPPGGGSSPPPGGGSSPPPGGGGAGRHTTAPGVSGFGLTNNPFVVGGSTPIFGTAAAKNTKKHTKNTKRHKLGTTLRYTLSEAATVRIVITQARSGRRRGKRCVAPTRSLRRARKCTRTLTRGTLTRTSHQGKNRVAFSGRIGSRKLAPGRYQATLTATDPAKITSKPRTITFMIVRR